MKAKGTISIVESAIEDLVRKVSADNDGRIERLARELGQRDEREKLYLERIANLEFDRNNQRERRFIEGARKGPKASRPRRRKEVA